jgi:vacuolar-type H+-ATPase subunit E/Vma4
MRTEFDNAAFDRWLEREDEALWDYALEEESAEEARARMTEAERQADVEWEREQYRQIIIDDANLEGAE